MSTVTYIDFNGLLFINVDLLWFLVSQLSFMNVSVDR